MMAQPLNTKYNCLGSYSDFLSTFLKRGYNFKKFSTHENKDGEVLLRHDIDFDITFAYQTALAEKELGITSTYFFLLRSEFYNPFSKSNFDLIKDIESMGHNISIHFDPSIYEDFKIGFDEELAYFKHVFKVNVDIVSIHRPNDFFQNHDQLLSGVSHTYQKKFFKDIKYFADSTGQWRFGNPIDSEEFKNLKSIHLLTHPIWWFVEGNNNLEVLEKHFNNRKISLKQNFYDNCIPFRKISDYV
ncbi:MAG: hypothetical protein ACO1N4_09105 [Pedobacter sp.]